ncbi:wd g-beta repeat-containing protein [Cyclospora cayetanensis]|uniref:Wd g-beta repeat-containing protein n=1 Tax=Cyclospora cayetanensis TaxID=88456 RepID=A0A1D3D9X9_9EIME|nr:wd g-beta repeat-containing protein [Cyclospora cayetanensis]
MDRPRSVYQVHKRRRRFPHECRAALDSLQWSSLVATRLMSDEEALDERCTPARRLASGHAGCVNRLSWHESGNFLASTSDDRRVLIWDLPQDTPGALGPLAPPSGDPFTTHTTDHHHHRGARISHPVRRIETGHQLNVFGVAFLGMEAVATGAMDSEVRLSSISRGVCLKRFTCHANQVKHIAALPHDSRNIWWSASDDGTIRQFDRREPHVCRRRDCRNVLISLSSESCSPSVSHRPHGNVDIAARRVQLYDLHAPGGGVLAEDRLLLQQAFYESAWLRRRFDAAEVKALSINPLRPEYLAVAANDPVVRVYDRRMLSLSGLRTSRNPPSHRVAAAAARGTPAHPLPPLPAAAWSVRGQVPCDTFVPTCLWKRPFEGRKTPLTPQQGCVKLLAGTLSSGAPSAVKEAHALAWMGYSSNKSTPGCPCRYCCLANEPTTTFGIPETQIRTWQLEGNALMERGLEGMAVCAYTRALRFAVAAHLRVPLLCNRALAQLRSKPRFGVSAAAAAERDAREAVYLDPYCPKAYYRLIAALRACSSISAASRVAREALARFPNVAEFRRVSRQLQLDVVTLASSALPTCLLPSIKQKPKCRNLVKLRGSRGSISSRLR